MSEGGGGWTSTCSTEATKTRKEQCQFELFFVSVWSATGAAIPPCAWRKWLKAYGHVGAVPQRAREGSGDRGKSGHPVGRPPPEPHSMALHGGITADTPSSSAHPITRCLPATTSQTDGCL